MEGMAEGKAPGRARRQVSNAGRLPADTHPVHAPASPCQSDPQAPRSAYSSMRRWCSCGTMLPSSREQVCRGAPHAGGGWRRASGMRPCTAGNRGPAPPPARPPAAAWSAPAGCRCAGWCRSRRCAGPKQTGPGARAASCGLSPIARRWALGCAQSAPRSVRLLGWAGARGHAQAWRGGEWPVGCAARLPGSGGPCCSPSPHTGAPWEPCSRCSRTLAIGEAPGTLCTAPASATSRHSAYASSVSASR